MDQSRRLKCQSFCVRMIATSRADISGDCQSSRSLAMSENVLKLHKGRKPGALKLGSTVIPCAVLEDGTRVISETGLTNALLGTRSGFSRRKRLASLEQGTPIPLFLAPGNLKPF